MVDASAFVSTVPVPAVDATGCHVPSFQAIYAALQADYRGVYGQDVNLAPDTTDGNWVGIQAVAFKNYADAFLATYNAFSPATAQGVGLSSVVKTNGIAREVATSSTVDLLIVGRVGTIISAGVAADDASEWLLPDPVIIPPAGQVIVTATCATPGAVRASAGTITTIRTPTQGWQSVTNPADATPGAPVETDATLRVRQSTSTMLPAIGIVDGMLGAVLGIPGVTRARIYENDTDAPDGNGIPGHTISLVADGGDAQAIATVIARRKLSAGTYGTTSEVVITGIAGIARRIAFFRPTQPQITWGVSVRAMKGYTTDVQAQIQAALAAWTNGLGIGAGDAGRIMLARAYAPALLSGVAARSFELLDLTVARDGKALAATDLPIAFSEAPLCTAGLVSVTATT